MSCMSNFMPGNILFFFLKESKQYATFQKFCQALCYCYIAHVIHHYNNLPIKFHLKTWKTICFSFLWYVGRLDANNGIWSIINIITARGKILCCIFSFAMESRKLWETELEYSVFKNDGVTITERAKLKDLL